MPTQTYPTDLTDRQWDYIRFLIPAPKPGGRPRTLDMRQVVNALLYIVVSGVQWRMLPKEYPAWQSVYHYFRMGGACKKLRRVWVDGTYRGQLIQWAMTHLWFVLEPVLRSDDQKGFVVLPHRWIVERTFAWLTQCRRLSKDYEALPQTSEPMIYLAMIRLMLRRLAPR